MVGWLDRLQRRSRVAGFLIAVIYKYVDDQGTYLAALITYYAFVSLFPGLLLLTTVLGVVLAGHPELQEQILQSAVAQFPVIGRQLGQPQGLSGGTVGWSSGSLGHCMEVSASARRCRMQWTRFGRCPATTVATPFGREYVACFCFSSSARR